MKSSGESTSLYEKERCARGTSHSTACHNNRKAGYSPGSQCVHVNGEQPVPRACSESQLAALQTHAIMGTNGSGKSTLSKCLVGHPDYEITGGSGNLMMHMLPGVGT